MNPNHVQAIMEVLRNTDEIELANSFQDEISNFMQELGDHMPEDIDDNLPDGWGDAAAVNVMSNYTGLDVTNEEIDEAERLFVDEPPR